MKLIFTVFCVIIAVSSIEGQGFPTAKCQPDEHSVLYCPQKAEPSCDNPTVHKLTGPNAGLCDVPQCFCNTPNVRNLKTGKCVPLSEC
ncbi:uncharacterized protein LOC123699766 [Colias croceus]|uniref:uncharacterized protein LOC123699766 n=1 Tax=Colias crocea TaxID=72248 RepID=UPI001E2803B3|nr:uncharacterized protein LOC123699766 [Colias croceus]